MRHTEVLSDLAVAVGILVTDSRNLKFIFPKIYKHASNFEEVKAQEVLGLKKTLHISVPFNSLYSLKERHIKFDIQGSECDLLMLDIFSFHMHLYYKQNKIENACAMRAQKQTGYAKCICKSTLSH